MIGAALQKVALRQPSSIAVDGPDGKVSYEELLVLVRTCAAHLQHVAPSENYIGLVADQTLGGVVALLAIMWAGKVAVPIDPRFETKLIADMLRPFTKTMLVDVPRKDAPDWLQMHIIDDLMRKKYQDAAGPQKQHLAYILHTSGTTGKPKAVMASQAALYKVARRLADRYYITKSTRVLQFAHLSFDSAVVEICSTLLTGGTLVVPGKQLREDLYGTLKILLDQRRIHVATLPPSVIIPVEPSTLGSLKSLIVAGEPCPPQLANRLYKTVRHFINAYGPTESIVCATTYEMKEPCNRSVPIGATLPGLRVTLHDPETAQQVTDGPGEIYISGDMLADGYAGDPRLTAQKFIDINDIRHYRSGDIAMLRPDGNFEYVGRIDNQVKINGQRVELEGIEATIQSVFLLEKVVVFVPEQGSSLVCAYIADTPISTADFTERLGKILPSFAIPLSYRHLSTMPLDRNGKVDRRAIQQLPSGTTTAYVDDSEVVRQMITIWQSILGSGSSIGAQSDFFEVGGDSLSAMRLIADISRVFNVTVSLSDILDDPITPKHMTETVTSRQEDV